MASSIITDGSAHESLAESIALLPDALQLIRNMASTFRFYVQQHKAKDTPMGDAKAVANEAQAILCEQMAERIGGTGVVEQAYLVWSQEHGRWWGSGGWGYTADIQKAGRYTKDRAETICAQANFGGRFNEMAIPCPYGIPPLAED